METIVDDGPAAFIPSVYDATCPTRIILDRISDKWTSLVIGRVARGTQRFSELRRSIDGISQKMLTQTLRGLERDGLVERTVHAEVPPRVEYQLTELGWSIVEPMRAVRDWAEANVEDVLEARAAYDARADTPVRTATA